MTSLDEIMELVNAKEPLHAHVIPIKDVLYHLEQGPDEQYSIPIIEYFLLTDHRKRQMVERGITISDCLNGHVGQKNEAFVQALFHAWNIKLGARHFGSQPTFNELYESARAKLTQDEREAMSYDPVDWIKLQFQRAGA